MISHAEQILLLPFLSLKLSYSVLVLELFDAWLIALLVLQAKVIDGALEKEGDQVVEDAEKEQIDSEEYARGPQIDASILRYIINGRADVYLVHLITINPSYHISHSYCYNLNADEYAIPLQGRVFGTRTAAANGAAGLWVWSTAIDCLGAGAREEWIGGDYCQSQEGVGNC